MVESSTDSRLPEARDAMIIRLVQHDRAEWESVFENLYPVAHEVSRMTLQGRLEAEVEDVALEALEALVDQVEKLNSAQELRPLIIRIARNKAIDRLRHFLALKRNANSEVSFQAFADAGIELPDGKDQFSIVDELSIRGLRELLHELEPNAKTQSWDVLLDVYLCGLSEDEVARKRGISSTSVRKYVQRGLAEIRDALVSNNVLKEELRDLLNIESRVPDCIPLMFASTMSGKRDQTMIHTNEMIRCSRQQRTLAEISEEKMILKKTLPESCHLPRNGKQRLMSLFGSAAAISEDMNSRKPRFSWAVIFVVAILIVLLALLLNNRVFHN
jgi:RNA polymerase sigma factor (sigma-70 family)